MNQLFTMVTILVLNGLGLLFGVSLYLRNGPETQAIASQMMFASIVMSMLHYVWLNWRPIAPEAEPVVEQHWGELVGDPEFDPVKGIYCNVLIGSVQTKVVIQPKWWKYFSSELIRSENESFCPGSPVNAVPPGKEPSYLVVIQDRDGNTRGMGCRARFGTTVVLLTAYHVTTSSDQLYLAKYSSSKKAGARIAIDKSWLTDFYAKDEHADIAGVIVPDRVWSSLGVGIVKARVPTAGRKPCQVFGADSSASVKSSTGLSWITDSFSGTHTATTAKSWSGSPIISGEFVIGVHKGADKFDQVNKFTLLHPVLFPRELETIYDEGYIREIDEEEIGSRESTFQTTRIFGRGDVEFAEYEFAVNTKDELLRLAKFKGKRGTWADMVDDDDDTFFDVPYIPEGLTDGDLNCQGAASACSLPSKNSEGINLPVPNQYQSPECHSLSLAERLSNLEKLLEPLLATVSSLQEQSSQNSKILTGLSAEVLRNSIPSSSKPPGSAKPKSRATSPGQSSNSAKSTPKVVVPPPSGESGIVSASKRKSRRSRRGKSKATPPQESPLRS